jgi:hypothetical protein
MLNGLLSKLARFKHSKGGDPAKTEKLVATKCSHATMLAGDVTAFGQTIQTEMPVENGEVEYCLECLAGMAIQCAWCELPVFIGDPVTLYSPQDSQFEVPPHAVVFSRQPLRVVGCLRWDCARTGGDRSGFWLPDGEGHGYVYRVASPLEQAMMGHTVMVQDVGDIAEATRLPAAPATGTIREDS